MKYRLLLISLFVYTGLAAQLTDSEIRDLKGGRIHPDTSYIYALPFEKGKSYFLIQGANSRMSHKDELSLDFKMDKGSGICASREGTVADVRSDSKKGGLKNENMADGNYIIITHPDGSVAQYWHLQTDGVFVKLGEHVEKGQLIGFSGNTGYTAFPHLHFQIIDKDGKQLLPRFHTKKGIKYLRPAKWHRAV